MANGFCLFWKLFGRFPLSHHLLLFWFRPICDVEHLSGRESWVGKCGDTLGTHFMCVVTLFACDRCNSCVVCERTNDRSIYSPPLQKLVSCCTLTISLCHYRCVTACSHGDGFCFSSSFSSFMVARGAVTLPHVTHAWHCPLGWYYSYCHCRYHCP